MREQNYWLRKATSSRLSRRRFVGGAAIGGVGAAGLALVGCGDDDDEAPSGGGDDPTATSAPAQPTNTSAPGATATTAPTNTPIPEAKRGGIYSTSVAAVYDSVDVHRAFGDPTSWLTNYILNKLVWYKNPDTGEIEGDLAESFESPDGQTYTFNLRPGVKWADVGEPAGRAFTSEDVRWHFERQASGVLSNGEETDTYRFATQAGVIETIDTPDDSTVVLKLAKPDGSFLDFLAAFRSTIPNRETTEKFEGDHRTLTEEAIVGTGPFILTHFRSGENVQMVKNPDYFREGVPVFDGQQWSTLFEDPTSQRIGFEQKQLDTFSNPDPSVTQAIVQAHSDEMHEIRTGVANTVFLHLNMNKQFKDVRHVRAVNMAFDRRNIISAFHQGLGQVSGPVTWIQEGYAVPGVDLIEHEGYRVDRDAEIADARALWEASDGASLGEVDIKVPDTWTARWPDTLQFTTTMLNEAFGTDQFKSTQSSYNEEIIPNLFNREFPNWWAWTSQVGSANPRASLKSNFHSTAVTNWNLVNDPAIDAIIDAFEPMTDLEESVAKVRELQDILLANGQFGSIVLYNYISVTARWNYLKGALKIPPSAANPIATGYNLFPGHIFAAEGFIDGDDPSASGRSDPEF